MEWTAVLVLCFTNTFIASEEWDRHLLLDPDGNYHLLWRINGNTAVFQVEVSTLGWFGFGLSPNGAMKGSDMVIGWIANGDTVFHDRHAEGNFMPIIDRQQDWKLLWSSENGTHTLFRFERKLNTCDEKDIPITGDTARLIYAYNSEDPSSASNVMYHGTKTRGAKSAYLLRNNKPKNILESELHHYWDVKSANALIPDDIDTTYYCSLVKRPELDTINHIVKIEPIIQAGNERFVHHMILYECADVEESELLPYLGRYHECYDQAQTPQFLKCLTVFGLWAVGGESYYLPKHGGIPLGRQNGKYYNLEVHYDNPGYQRGVVDSSGFRITYTPNLRKHNVGVLAIGSLPYACMFIPPRQKQFVVPGHAYPACLKQRLPEDGIKVIAIILHSHLIGKSIRVRHFRGDEELQPLAKDDNYDFNYQSLNSLQEERLVLPNDHLITECTYDSSAREETTFGGLGTKQEMCVALLLYYPETSLSASTSCPSPYNLVKRVGVTQISDDDRFVISPITGKNESFIDFLNSYPWDENSINDVQKAMKFSPHINLCFDRGNKVLPVIVLSKYPKVKKVFQKQDECSGKTSNKF